MTVTHQPITHLVFCHLHVQNDVIEQVLNRLLNDGAEARAVNHAVNELKHAVDETLEAQLFTCV